MNSKSTVLGLACDLKRVGRFIQTGSVQSAHRFTEESLKGIQELEVQIHDEYIGRLLKKTKDVLLEKDKENRADDLLTYGELFLQYGMTEN